MNQKGYSEMQTVKVFLFLRGAAKKVNFLVVGPLFIEKYISRFYDPVRISFLADLLQYLAKNMP